MRKLSSSFVLIGLCVHLGGGAARAEPLRDLREVKLTIAGFGDAGADCGLSPEALESAFFAPLGERGLRKVASGTAYRIFLRATTVVYLGKSCVSYVDAQLLLSTRDFDPSSRLERSGQVQLWYDGGLFISDRTAHAATLHSAFGQPLSASWAGSWPESGTRRTTDTNLH